MHTTKESLVNDLSHAKLIADSLADSAEATGLFPRRQAYQVLRNMNPDDLYELYRTRHCKGKKEFIIVFGKIYHDMRGDGDGPLFQ